MQAPEEVDLSNSNPNQPPSPVKGWLIAFTVIAIGLVLCGFLWFGIANRSGKDKAETAEKLKESGEVVEVTKNEPAVQVITADDKSPPDKVKVTGVVESNQQQVQQISALVAVWTL